MAGAAHNSLLKLIQRSLSTYMPKPEAKILFQSREITKSYNTRNFVRLMSLKQAHMTYGLLFKQEEWG